MRIAERLKKILEPNGEFQAVVVYEKPLMEKLLKCIDAAEAIWDVHKEKDKIEQVFKLEDALYDLELELDELKPWTK